MTIAIFLSPFAVSLYQKVEGLRRPPWALLFQCLCVSRFVLEQTCLEPLALWGSRKLKHYQGLSRFVPLVLSAVLQAL